MYDAEPIVGNWYHYPETTRRFKVVSVDAASGEIELQYLDGRLDQIDFYIWGTLGAQRVGVPEDWTTSNGDSQHRGNTNFL